jgi:hypothetical protein
MAREQWYNGLSEIEKGRLQTALENRMMFKNESQKESVWENLLNEQYDKYLNEIESKKVAEQNKEKELKEAEEQYKKDLSMGVATLELYTSNKYHAWVAEITGADDKFGFKRSFVNQFDKNGSYQIYLLKEGKRYNFLRNNEQVYAQVVNSRIIEMSKFEMLELISK